MTTRAAVVAASMAAGVVATEKNSDTWHRLWVQTSTFCCFLLFFFVGVEHVTRCPPPTQLTNCVKTAAKTGDNGRPKV